MSNRLKQRTIVRKRRVRRTRARIFGTPERPRVSFFRSNVSNYAQVINDEEGRTLLSAFFSREQKRGLAKKIDAAILLGELLAKKMKEAGLTKGVFDRRSYKYHGRVRAFVDGLRNGGIEI